MFLSSSTSAMRDIFASHPALPHFPGSFDILLRGINREVRIGAAADGARAGNFPKLADLSQFVALCFQP
ncbi:MAG: hypothetical protein JSR87_05180 [Proteobacteria bacterium]|nr:hypothetical protein [Pseudomonadota bacterium]